MEDVSDPQLLFMFMEGYVIAEEHHGLSEIFLSYNSGWQEKCVKIVSATLLFPSKLISQTRIVSVGLSLQSKHYIQIILALLAAKPKCKIILKKKDSS